MKKLTFIISGTLFLALVIYASIPRDNADEQKVSSYAENPAGLSRFTQALEESEGKEGVQRLMAPVLKEEVLADTSLLVITSVNRSVSELEAKTILDYVGEGGTVFLSFHNTRTKTLISDLLRPLELPRLKPVEGFKNGEVAEARAKEDSTYWKSGETFAFYSHKMFHREDCLAKGQAVPDVTCYMQIFQHGTGQVIVLLGLPFFANGLIGQADNPRLAARLFSGLDRTVFDEYHHFFSDKTVGAMMGLPAFYLPLGGLILITILFFLLGPSHQIEPVSVAPTDPPRGFHDVNVGLVQSELKMAQAESVASLRDYILRQFPANNKRTLAVIAELKGEGADAKQAFWRLVAEHKRYLTEKGRRPAG